MKKVKAKNIRCGDTIIAKATTNGKGIYGYLTTPFFVDTFFMTNKPGHLFPSDDLIRFNGNGAINAIRPELGMLCTTPESIWFIK